MPEKRPKRGMRYFFAICVGILVGSGMSFALKGYIGAINDRSEQEERATQRGASETHIMPEAPANDAGMRYAQAVMAGDWETVIAQTLWMRERLAYVASTSAAGDDARQEAIDALAGELSDRAPVEAQLLPEGVEDKYVFSPGAELEWLGQDEGEEELEQPTDRRTLIRVTYPVKSRALRDEANIPIKSLVVGVNLTIEGEVLKANTVGNLDILRETISYAWSADSP